MTVTESHCSVLLVDIAGSSRLRAELGDAAASRQITLLLDSIVAIARERGAGFVKVYGDDMLATFDRADGVTVAAELAILANRLAERAGLRLYAGVHAGPVEYRITDGHTDVYGQTINICARLHKLIEDTPGSIFLVEETVQRLTPELQHEAARFGTRTLRNIGSYEIWTLGWRPTEHPTATVYAPEPTLGSGLPLQVRTLDGEWLLPADGRRHAIGRGVEAAVRIADPERRVSSVHVAFECLDGHWLVQDLSRNGTWMHDAATGAVTLLPYCQKALAPRAGALTLGRPPGEDPAENFRIRFELQFPT